ncbi:MAG: hypothetical protein ACERKO_05580, partial [Acetanaerobacterium sp.]
AINRFASDSDAELALIKDACLEMDAEFALSEVFARAAMARRSLQRRCVRPAKSRRTFTRFMTKQCR